MKTALKTLLLLAALTACISVLPPLQAAETVVTALREKPEAGKKPLVQIAILLDTSGSMDGLINQARSQLWKIVNEFVSSEQNGRKPELQVALYEYGKSTIPASEGHLRMILPLTTDLDKVSEELFKLATNGGGEFCGQVIKSAVDSLAWSPSSADYKAIFIAGNEPFTQGAVNYADACKAAIARGILVNTIHCGPHATGVASQWQDGALLADGKFLNIEQDQKVVHIEAPQDAEIAKLGVAMNGTYLAFGEAGQAGQKRQTEQDANAESARQGANVQRALSKSSAHYDNAGWDLVDAKRKSAVKLEEMKVEDLPAEMKALKPEERAAFVDGKEKERAAIQEKISALNAERNKYVAEELKKRAGKGEDTLDAAVTKTVREQAAKKQFSFKQ